MGFHALCANQSPVLYTCVVYRGILKEENTGSETAADQRSKQACWKRRGTLLSLSGFAALNRKERAGKPLHCFVVHNAVPHGSAVWA
jgi:hypothetical protein